MIESAITRVLKPAEGQQREMCQCLPTSAPLWLPSARIFESAILHVLAQHTHCHLDADSVGM